MQNIKKSRVLTLCLATLAALPVVIAGGLTQAAPAQDQGESRAAPSKGSRVDKDEYSVELKAPASCKAGAACTVEISLKSKGEFHVNDKYPIKFKAPDAPPDGVTFAKSVVRKEDGKFAEKEGTLPVQFTAARPGKVTINGTFSFGVCRDTQCLMEKIELAVDVDVK